MAEMTNSISDAAIGNPFESGTLSIQSNVLGGSVDEDTANKTDVKSGRSTPAATLTMSAQGVGLYICFHSNHGGYHSNHGGYHSNCGGYLSNLSVNHDNFIGFHDNLTCFRV